MRYNLFFAIVLTIVSVTMMYRGWRAGSFEKNKPTEPIEQHKCITPAKHVLSGCMEVIGTTYNPSIRQTDTEPYITASGFKINKTNPSKSRVLGVPRWMLKKFNKNGLFEYGDTVFVLNKDDLFFKYNGFWRVEDCTSNNNYNSIDFCVSKDDTMNVFRNFTICKYR